MKGNTKAMALSVAAIFAISMLAMGVMADKPQPPAPTPTEPTGKFVSGSGLQPVLSTGSYVKQFDWVNGQFNHTWSGKTDYNGNHHAVIGDIDNDGKKEVLTAGTYSTTTGSGKNKVTTTKRTWNLWQDGDASDSPSLTFDPGFVPGFMEIGDVNNDGKNELVMSGTTVLIWSWNGTGFTEDARIANVGSGGLTIADTDNDGKNELTVGMAKNADGTSSGAAVMEYSNGSYSVVARLGPNSGCQIDDVSVGDLDGDGKKELFGSGYCNGNIYVWKYANNAYGQVWTTQETSTEFHQSNEIADVNGDGKNEIAFGELNNKNLVVYKYDGNNSWSRLGKYANNVAMQMDMLFSADFDGDGDTELLAQDLVWDWDGSVMKNTQDLLSGTTSGSVSLA